MIKSVGIDLAGNGEHVEDRTALLSDNDTGYLSQQFNQYLRLVGIRHITASSFHPKQTARLRDTAALSKRRFTRSLDLLSKLS